MLQGVPGTATFRHMGPPSVSFYYDYVDPASYLLDRVLRMPEFEGDVTLDFRPLELRPATDPLIDPHSAAWTARLDVVDKASEHFAIAIGRPDIVPWSQKAHELALHAVDKGCFDAVHAALFRAFFADGKDIGRVDLLVALAADTGLDATETKAVLDVDRYAGRVAEMREEAIGSGIRGAPTLESGERRLQGLPDRVSLTRFLDGLRTGSTGGPSVGN